MEAINITAYTSDVTQIEAVKAVLKAFKIQFKVTKQKAADDFLYNPEFVEKVRKSEQEFEEGNYISLKQEDFKQFLGL